MSGDTRHFKSRALTQVLFSGLCGLLLLAVILQMNFDDPFVVEWTQLGLILVMMSLGLLELRRINRGMRDMARVADSIGQGDFEARVSASSKDSLGMLGQAINRMAERIEQSMREIELSQKALAQSKEVLATQNDQLTTSMARQKEFGQFLTDLAAIDINSLANKALAHIGDTAKAYLGAFYLWDEEAERLICLSTRGLDRHALAQMQNSGCGLPLEVHERGEAAFIEDLAEIELPAINLGIGRAQAKCIYGLPVLFRQRGLGVVILAGPRKPDPELLEYLHNHLEALGNSLNNALTYKQVNRQSLLLEKANNELRHADKVRSEFVANMSHELRTPLNSIIGFSGILLKNKAGKLEDADLKRAEKINRNGKHLLNLINDILDLSKVEAGRMEVQIAPVKLASVLAEVLDLLHPQAEARGLGLELDVPEQPVVLDTDDHKLKQVLINLMGNAVKFTRDGRVILRLKPPQTTPNSTVIEVQDTGIGIPADKLETIFEAFRQADNTTTREYGGTGLGLTISQSLAKILGGVISVESEVGKGTIFRLTLPAPAANVSAETLGTPSGPRPSTLVEQSREILARSLPVRPGHKVLVIDDDADARELICQYITDLGATPVSCDQPARAVEVARAERPNLVTLDLMMPERSGWEVLSALKAEPDLRATPVIIISIVADRRRAISLGAVDALTKPIIRGDFNASVQRNLTADISLSRVLVVEDDLDTSQLMTAWLAPEVQEIRTAANGREALDLLREYRPDMIFLDLQMPVMNGTEFLQRLRADAALASIPVIVVTASDLAPAARTELQAQVSKILIKGEVFAN